MFNRNKLSLYLDRVLSVLTLKRNSSLSLYSKKDLVLNLGKKFKA